MSGVIGDITSAISVIVTPPTNSPSPNLPGSPSSPTRPTPGPANPRPVATTIATPTATVSGPVATVAPPTAGTTVPLQPVQPTAGATPVTQTLATPSTSPTVVPASGVQNKEAPSGGKIQAGAVVGIILGLLVLMAAVAGFAWYRKRKLTRARHSLAFLDAKPNGGSGGGAVYPTADRTNNSTMGSQPVQQYAVYPTMDHSAQGGSMERQQAEAYGMSGAAQQQAAMSATAQYAQYPEHPAYVYDMPMYQDPATGQYVYAQQQPTAEGYYAQQDYSAQYANPGAYAYQGVAYGTAEANAAAGYTSMPPSSALPAVPAAAASAGAYAGYQMNQNMPMQSPPNSAELPPLPVTPATNPAASGGAEQPISSIPQPLGVVNAASMEKMKARGGVTPEPSIPVHSVQ